MGKKMLEVKNLKTKYVTRFHEDVYAVDGVSFSIADGETFGLGRGAQTDASFLLQFLHASGEAAVGVDIDALTGATVTSKAVTRAVNSAAAFVTGADVSSGATEWEG